MVILLETLFISVRCRRLHRPLHETILKLIFPIHQTGIPLKPVLGNGFRSGHSHVVSRPI